VNRYGFSSLLADLRQYWTADAGCLATPGSAVMTAQLGRFNGVLVSAMLGGEDERLDMELMLASEESHEEDEVVDESVDEAERLRWQL
jgi:hypothetical protein